jgi:acyl transferase domain-containing protein
MCSLLKIPILVYKLFLLPTILTFKTSSNSLQICNANSKIFRYKRAGLDPTLKSDRCQYFEAHGTGTPAGDPQEASALDQSFFPNHDEAEGELLVGSVKTVIGHTEGTAGIAGILKATLAIQHGIIPPNLLFNKVSPAVAPFTKFLRIPTACEPWPQVAEGQPRRASINSFGFGGANAHCIIESYESEKRSQRWIENGDSSDNETAASNGLQTNEPHTNGTHTNEVSSNGSGVVNINGHANGHIHGTAITNGTNANHADKSKEVGTASYASSERSAEPAKAAAPKPLIPLVFSSESLESLVTLLQSVLSLLEEVASVDLPSLAYTLSTRRSALSLRLPVYAASVEDLRQKSQEKLGGAAGASHSVAALQAPPSILGIFTGQGAQWAAMGAKLFAANPLARSILDHLDTSLATLPVHFRPTWTLAEVLCTNSNQSVAKAEISQPICTAVQITLVDLLRSAGVEFKAVVGHSSGEIAAAYAAGYLSAEDAIRIVSVELSEICPTFCTVS